MAKERQAMQRPAYSKLTHRQIEQLLEHERGLKNMEGQLEPGTGEDGARDFEVI